METNDWWNDPTKRDQTLKVNTEPVPPPPPVKRNSSFVLVVCVFCLVIIAGGSVIFSTLHSSYSHAIITIPRVIMAQSVVAAIAKQPGNNASGKEITYGVSLADWMNNAYEDVFSPESSAEWYGDYCCGSGGLAAVWVYTATSDAQREYTLLQQETTAYDTNLQTWPIGDVGPTSWTYDGHCIAGNISTTDAIALENAC